MGFSIPQAKHLCRFNLGRSNFSFSEPVTCYSTIKLLRIHIYRSEMLQKVAILIPKIASPKPMDIDNKLPNQVIKIAPSSKGVFERAFRSKFENVTNNIPNNIR